MVASLVEELDRLTLEPVIQQPPQCKNIAQCFSPFNLPLIFDETNIDDPNNKKITKIITVNPDENEVAT